LKKLVLLLFFTISFSLHAVELDPDGNKVKRGVNDYKEGKFESSLNEFRSVEKKNDPRLDFNQGTAYYKLGEYDKAIEKFSNSLKTQDKELRKKALHNLGNSYYKQGNKRKAAESYIESLKVDPDYLPPRKNLEILNKKEKDEDKEDKNQDQKNQDQKNEEQKQNSSSAQGKKDNHREKDRQEQLKEEAMDRIFKSGNPEKINHKKVKPEYEKIPEKFW